MDEWMDEGMVGWMNVRVKQLHNDDRRAIKGEFIVSFNASMLYISNLWER